MKTIYQRVIAATFEPHHRMDDRDKKLLDVFTSILQMDPEYQSRERFRKAIEDSIKKYHPQVKI